MISMNQIPANLRVPLFYMEFDNSGAVQGGVTQEYRTLLIGNKLNAGTAGALSLNRITSVEQAEGLFGVGSVLADMVAAHLKINKIQPVYAVPMADNGAGVAASGKLSFTGPASASGIIYLLIGGRLIEVGVTSGDAATAIATAAAAAITADTRCLCSAAVDGTNAYEVNLTAKNKGVHGNSIDVRHSHYEGQALPTGVGLTITAMASGAGNPDVSSVWPVIGDQQYILTVTPWTDATNLGKVETEFADRFGPLNAADGFALYGVRGTFGDLVTIGEGRNSQFTTFMGVKGPSNPWVWASQVAAQVALAASIDPARPFATLPLSSVIAPKKTEQFTLEERNQLLYAGISTFMVDSGGNVLIEKMITSFKKNAFGSPDTSYLSLNTPLTLSYLRFDLKAKITSKYPRHKLASDGTRFAPGQAIVTPLVIKAEIIAKFREWEQKGLVEGVDQFKAQLIVERNADNPNRVDVLMPPDLVNQFDVLAIKNQFLL